MKVWYTFVVIFCVGFLSVGMIIGIPKMDGKEERQKNRQEKNCMRLIDDYMTSYQKYLLFKYDGAVLYSSDVMNTKWLEIQNDCPELYEELVLPIKIKWDSIKNIPVEKTLYEGIPQNVLEYKLKYKEIDKRKTKIKVKKSDGVDIENHQESISGQVLIDSIKNHE